MPCATAILSVCGAGDHLLVVRQLSMSRPGNSATRTLKRFGVQTSYYAPNDDIAPLLKPNTKAVFCESPGSLTFEMQDIPAIAKAAHAHGASRADGQYLGDALCSSGRWRMAWISPSRPPPNISAAMPM